MTDAGTPRERLVALLRRGGAATRQDVLDAFATVPRETFLTHGFRPGGDDTQVHPGDEGFLDAVYRDDALVTKYADGAPVSSSSQPSLMAAMLEALDPHPGARVLEIGAGTGYNAALLAALGASVVSVDAQADVAQRAAEALAAAGVTAARVVHGDGYQGAPDAAPYDRVIVTVGVAGISPRWLDQLAPGGFVLAPVGHAGGNPVLRVSRTDDGAVRARAVCGAGFMPASGPLSARHPWAHPAPWRVAAPEPTVRLPERWRPPLTPHRFADLCFAVGAWDRRATTGPPDLGGCVLLDEGGVAAIHLDGSVRAAGPAARRVAEDAADLVDRWAVAGLPALPRWRATCALTGDPAAPIWVPRDWTLAAGGRAVGPA
jgi:protein-L-isoaspartate(D-aspartate) O-methyltransferase